MREPAVFVRRCAKCRATLEVLKDDSLFCPAGHAKALRGVWEVYDATNNRSLGLTACDGVSMTWSEPFRAVFEGGEVPVHVRAAKAARRAKKPRESRAVSGWCDNCDGGYYRSLRAHRRWCR